MTPTQGEHAQTAAQVQRYKIGYPTDSWGERSSTPSGIPDHAGAWVRYEDHAAQVAALTPAQPAAPQGGAEVNWWEVDGDKYDDSITRAPPAPTAQAAPAAGAVAGPTSMPPSAFLNAAGIKADDMPGTVVRKLDAAFHEAVTFADAAPTPAAQADDVGAWAVRVEKLLCEKLGRPWSAEGISINSLIDELAAQADSVLEDAARWRMAVLVGKEVMLHPEKRTHANAVKAYMDAVHSGLDLTGAVDAARKRGASHD